MTASGLLNAKAVAVLLRFTKLSKRLLMPRVRSLALKEEVSMFMGVAVRSYWGPKYPAGFAMIRSGR
jgi:hypothetical protein